MNNIKRLYILSLLIFTCLACHQKAIMDKTPIINEAPPPTPMPPVEEVKPPPPPPPPQETTPQKIIRVLQKMYQWQATQGGAMDFPLIDNGERYTGLNQTVFAQRLKQLQATKLFATGFLSAYNQIAQEIHRRLSTGEAEYWIGDMPPYGNDVDPWTNSQDAPAQFWYQFRIQNFQFQGTQAQFTWHWPVGYGDQPYWVGMVKEQGQWRINYLQGFDLKTFFPK